MITKSEEIAAIKQLAEKLGPDSYCGPWLLSQLPGIEADIRSDIRPMHSYAEDRAFRQELCDQARETATQIKAEAIRERDRILADASRMVKGERDALIRLLQQTLSKLQ